MIEFMKKPLFLLVLVCQLAFGQNFSQILSGFIVPDLKALETKIMLFVSHHTIISISLKSLLDVLTSVKLQRFLFLGPSS